MILGLGLPIGLKARARIRANIMIRVRVRATGEFVLGKMMGGRAGDGDGARAYGG